MNRAQKRYARHQPTIDSFQIRGTSIDPQCGLVAPENRKCTDSCCGGFFWLTVFAMLGVSLYCIAKGNIMTLLAPVDGETPKNICGLNDASGYPYLFFTNIDGKLADMFNTAICVSKCPNKGDTTECFEFNGAHACPAANYDTNLIGLYCFPEGSEVSDTFSKLWQEFMNDSSTGQFIQDLVHAWKPCMICLVLGIIYTIIFMYALAYCTNLLAFLSIAIIEVFLLAGMGGAAYAATQQEDEQEPYWVMFGVSLFAWLIFNCLLCCCWKKVKVAIAVIDATADFLVATFRLAFVNFLYAFLYCIYLIVFLASVMAVTSMNEITASDDQDSFQGKEINWDSKNLGFMIFIGISWIWVFSYILDQVTFIVMSSAAQFYFTSNVNKTGSASVLSSMHMANFKHSGSIALGSGIHTMLVVIHMINETAQSAVQNSDNAIAKIICCLISCCLDCLEALIEYLTALSYAMMSISGDPYCSSAWNGFILNLKHCVKFYMAITIGKMFVFMGCLGVVAANAGTCYLLLHYAFAADAQQVSFIYGPIIVVSIVTLMITMVFLGPFNDAVISTLLCFAVDCELNNGTPQYGPPSYQDKLKAIDGDEEPGNRLYSAAPEPNYQHGYNTNANTIVGEQQPLNYSTGYNQNNNGGNSMF